MVVKQGCVIALDKNLLPNKMNESAWQILGGDEVIESHSIKECSQGWSHRCYNLKK